MITWLFPLLPAPILFDALQQLQQRVSVQLWGFSAKLCCENWVAFVWEHGKWLKCNGSVSSPSKSKTLKVSFISAAKHLRHVILNSDSNKHAHWIMRLSLSQLSKLETDTALLIHAPASLRVRMIFSIKLLKHYFLHFIRILQPVSTT